MESEFIKVIEERMKRDQNPKEMRYADYRRLRKLVPMTVRLPATTLAKLELLEENLVKDGKVWESRQELFYEMVESCIDLYIRGQKDIEKAQAAFDAAAKKGMTDL